MASPLCGLIRGRDNLQTGTDSLRIVIFSILFMHTSYVAFDMCNIGGIHMVIHMVIKEGYETLPCP